jgi:hypothetical protein
MPGPSKEIVSAFPTAHVARVLDPHEDKLGATLVARQLGHLAVKVCFHREPCYGLEVKFYEQGDDGKKAKQLGAARKTDRHGIARYEYLVDRGLYVVEIEKQESAAIVPTVIDPTKPYVIPTPVDRPYFDIGETPEFDHEVRTVDDYEGAGDGDAEALDGDTDGVMTVAFAASSSGSLDEKYPRFLLESTDGAYSREIAAKSAVVDKDGYQQIVFRGLDPDAKYRLTKIENEEYRRVIFDDAPYDAVVYDQHDAGDSLADHGLLGFEAGAPGDVSWT